MPKNQVNLDYMEMPYAGTISITSGECSKNLYQHQKDALQKLDPYSGIIPFKGLLVLPTGGGKTLTASYWLAKNYINKGKKILWIAHRHELLEQAKVTFWQIAYSSLIKERDSFNYRIISGLHDKPVNIKKTDDIIISSKDSLQSDSAFNFLFQNGWIEENEELFLVIDEAHHAPAKSYRRIIERLEDRNIKLQLLGLTATPFRTAESEKGFLKQVFPDDIIYKIDLKTLINRGILSEPIFIEKETEIDMTSIISDEEMDRIQHFDIDKLGTKAAKAIAENKIRNRYIVDHYYENKEKYGKTLLFALNVDNAIALNSLFKCRGIKSEYVLSSIRDSITGVTISSEKNKENIDKFRNGDLDILINLNILTEGIDLPNVQTVFLTRPTISSILMTQMVGRGLRGVKAGGTKNAYIVSFIDNWKEQVKWVNPETLLDSEKIVDIDRPSSERTLRIVSIRLIEEFAKILDQTINTEELERLDFISRIPIGIFAFTIFNKLENGETQDVQCEILVFDNIKNAYEDFFDSLSGIFEEYEEKELTEEILENITNQVEKICFSECEKYPGYSRTDIKNVLRYYDEYNILPNFISFEEREKYDITRLAEEIQKLDLRQSEATDYIDNKWEEDPIGWKVFFGYRKKNFRSEIRLALDKIQHPEEYERKLPKPNNEPEKRPLEDLTLTQIRKINPEKWRELHNHVFKGAMDTQGFFHCKNCDHNSKNKLDFQIDHINPISKGGKSIKENLQLLCRKCNMLKADKN
ncbi:DEAD/DEAH box helicase family protein [Methanospirillum sp.]|uniref:DEAD/DEAH box helicase family protein n=1 Tax=Methanospirillum sp. TaxID=45200 RepID=UPI00359F50BA